MIYCIPTSEHSFPSVFHHAFKTSVSGWNCLEQDVVPHIHPAVSRSVFSLMQCPLECSFFHDLANFNLFFKLQLTVSSRKSHHNQ